VTSTTSAAADAAGVDQPGGGGDPDSAPRRRRRWIVALVGGALVLTLAGVFVLWRHSREQPPPADAVRCSVYWRASPTVQPSHAGDVTMVTRNPPMGENEQRLAAGPMAFVARVPNIDPGFRQGPGSDGSDLSIDVLDGQGHRLVSNLYQIWSGPTDDFGGHTGFTGLVYVDDPVTGAEVQYSCATAG
jgi:hypothetical protein